MESPRYSASRGGCPLNAYQWPDLVAYDTSDQPLNPSPGASAWTSLVASCRDCRGVHTSMESSCQKVACFISHQACCKKRHEVHIFLRCKNHKNRNRELLQKTLKKMKSISNDDEMVLMFLNKINKKYWVHPIIRRRYQEGELPGLIQKFKLSYIFQDVRLSSCGQN